MMSKTFYITSNVKKLFSLTNMVKNVRTMSTQDVIFESINKAGVMTLNRPKSLNALDLSMVSKILPTLNQWKNEKALVIVKGSGGKAFCSGGDVRAVVEAGRRGDRLGHDFFRTEYTMNGLIGEYSIPYISLLDGIVMGGGVGISIHGSHRVATEKSLFAMPETAIGLFPDVGGSYVLPRLQGKLGYYLALTGYRLKGADVMKAGIATHYCESGKINDLEKELLKCDNHSSVKSIIEKFSTDEKTEFSLKPVIDKIHTCFTGETMEGIMESLEKDGSNWAKDTLKTLSSMSPTSLKVSLKLLHLGSKLNLKECLQMEYRVAVNCLANHDFYEGVRALLIDKDKTPKWKPATLKEVSDSYVDSHFSKLPENEELRHKL